MRRDQSKWWSAGFRKEWWDGLTIEQRFIFMETLTDAQVDDFYRDWRVWAREKQLAPEGIWTTWLLMAGRGFGKTRTGVEFVNDEVKTGRCGRIALVGQGESDIREVMIEGESGFLATAANDFRPKFSPSVGSGRLVWPNGAVGFTYSAEDPEALRGPQFDLALFDEPMAVPAEKRQKTVSNLKFGLRLGRRPRLVYTTTPKPHRWLTDELNKAQRFAHLPVEQQKYVVTRGSTLENRENLAESFFEGIMDDYDGTNLGRQEIYAEILGTEEGALWTAEMLKGCRLPCSETADKIWTTEALQAFARESERVVVGVDPNVTKEGKTAHAAGIVVLAKRGSKRYVLADLTVKGGPAQWGKAAVQAAIFYDADEIVAEVNQGGEMVSMVIKGAARELEHDIRVVQVRATKGKIRRAEPVATAYERGDVYHLGQVGSTDKPGPFFKLESQMCSLHDGHDPTGEDFDRADALVWGLTRLGLKRPRSTASTSAGGGFFSFGELIHG